MYVYLTCLVARVRYVIICNQLPISMPFSLPFTLSRKFQFVKTKCISKKPIYSFFTLFEMKEKNNQSAISVIITFTKQQVLSAAQYTPSFGQNTEHTSVPLTLVDVWFMKNKEADTEFYTCVKKNLTYKLGTFIDTRDIPLQN